jgi:glutamyl-Q tRNA(Asp) synthetase
VTALGSYLDARAHGGQWLVRMEDVDRPREQPGAADAILATLDAYGLHWDGPVLYQHTRLGAYAEAIEELISAGMAYPCACSRREIADSGIQGLEGPVYPGTCSKGLPGGTRARAVRVRVPPDENFMFTDLLQATVCQHLASDIGDFVVRRADGCFAYQLAVVVDDAFQGVTHIVRGADLLLSTPRQIYLQCLLHLQPSIYMHLPVAVNAGGKKLSKQTGAGPLDPSAKSVVMFQALQFLEQHPPSALLHANPDESLKWAVSHWNPAQLQGKKTRKLYLESI